MGRTIAEIQQEIEAAISNVVKHELPAELNGLAFLAPAGMSPRISLQYARNQRQIRRTADASYFQPAECVIHISFEPETADSPSNGGEPAAELCDVILALNKAENDPRFREFVGLKPFRDSYLTKFGYAWAQNRDGRDRVLREAIDQRLILRKQIPNPKSPQFPTTAIYVHSEHPIVESLLINSRRERSPFRPVAIRGDSLSATVLSERR